MTNEARRSSRVWLLAALLLGCSSAPPSVVVHNTVLVSVSGGPHAGRVPPTVNLRDKRIGVAFDAIAELLGHPVAFEIDDSLIPKFGDQLHEAFIEALETLVTSLEYARRYEPDALAYAGARLGTVYWTYSPSRGQARSELDVERQRLEVPVPANERRLLPDGLVVSALDRAWEREKVRRYADAQPAAVPVEEHRFYLDYLRSHQRPPDGETKLQKEQRAMARLRKILDLYPRIVDSKVRDEAARFLVHSGRDVRSWFAQTEELPGVLPHLRAVHGKWIQWLNGSFLRLGEQEQRDLATLFFTYSYEQAPGFEEGLDLALVAEPALASWRARSLDANRRSFDTRDALNALIVCPMSHENHRFGVSHQHCNGLLYTGLSGQGRSFTPLLRFLRDAEDSRRVTQFAVLHVLNNLGAEAAARFVEDSWQDDAGARAALVALAEYGGWGARGNRRRELAELKPEPFLQRLPTWWKAHPKQRPALLYLLVTLGDEYEGSVVWPKLHGYLGAPLRGEEIAGFLQQSPRTIWYLRNFVHSLAEGWSRSKTMIPELERFLNEFNAAGGGEPSPYYVTERCMEFLCIAGTTADVVALQQFLRDRVERYPSEARSLNSFIEAKPSRSCPSAKAEAERDARAANPSVLFGD